VIKIVDNFFDEDILKNIQNHITTKLIFTPSYSYDDNSNIENYYGDRFLFKNDLDLLDVFSKKSEEKFKIKIKDISDGSGIDLKNLDEFKPHTDTDAAKINILVMLHGPIAVTNGTVFYTDDELDIHVGFRPNRAVLFPSDHYHSPHASAQKGIRRYTATLFVSDYEDLI
jgi:hypothetical protein